MNERKDSIETKLIHAGEISPRVGGAVSLPIFQSAMYETPETDDGDQTVRYIRYNNTPNQEVLASKLAALEGADDAVVTGSGMAAISASLLTVLSPGDHFLAWDCLYGGTHGLVNTELARYKITHSLISDEDASRWEEQLTPDTRAVYVEAMTNPLCRVPDLRRIVDFCKAHGLVSLIDSTFATPINFRPPEFGFDISLHSATKYIGGHADVVAGAVIGRKDLVTRIRATLKHLGGTLDPHAAFLVHRGLKTLAVRMRHHNESALKLTRFLEKHPGVERISYPGLESHPDHSRAREFFDGFGGMAALEVKGGTEAGIRLVKSLDLAVNAPSLGGPETLVTRPVRTSHKGVPPRERERMGISDSLIRLSVGLESTEDLMADFDRALSVG